MTHRVIHFCECGVARTDCIPQLSPPNLGLIVRVIWLSEPVGLEHVPELFSACIIIKVHEIHFFFQFAFFLQFSEDDTPSSSLFGNPGSPRAGRSPSPLDGREFDVGAVDWSSQGKNFDRMLAKKFGVDPKAMRVSDRVSDRVSQ